MERGESVLDNVFLLSGMVYLDSRNHLELVFMALLRT